MKHYIRMATLATVIGTSTVLSGCLTREVLSNGGRTNSETARVVHKDEVASFVIDKNTGRLFMIGRDYVYAIDDNKSAQFIKNIIQYKDLDIKRLYVYTVNGVEYKLKDKFKLELNPKNNTFSFTLAMTYDVKNQQDEEFFTQNGLIMQKRGRDYAWLPYDRSYYNDPRVIVTGTIYKDNSATVQQLRQNAAALRQGYPISIYTVGTDLRNYGKGLGATVLLLPFALAADVITAPLQFAFKDMKINP